MKIIVPIKQILDPKGITVRRDKERIFINQEDYILDRSSKAAIEAALCLKESSAATADSEVSAICLGEARADAALREALAMGCDAAYLLSDPAFKQADVSVTVHVLAAAASRVCSADLIITGRESSDTGSGQIGPRLAEALGCAQVTDVYELAAGDGSLRATRRWGQAGYATVEVKLPAVVTVAPEAFKPRYPHGARIMNAYREWQVTVWGVANLDLDEAALQPLLVQRGESFPPPLEVGETFRGDPASVAQDVVTALRLQRLI